MLASSHGGIASDRGVHLKRRPRLAAVRLTLLHPTEHFRSGAVSGVMTTHDLLDRLDGIVHEATQVHDHGVDLTLAEVYNVDFPGRVDFGGGELEDADCSSHDRVWRNDDDEYRWWHLEGGQYLIEYNESLVGDESVVVQTRDAVLARGAFHPTVTVDTLDRLPLAVPPAGIRLKENARVSTVKSI